MTERPFYQERKNKFLLMEETHYKPENERRTQRVIIRLTPNDEERLRNEAERYGVKLSTYCRNILLNSGEENIFIDRKIRRMVVNLANNLNQLTLHYNRSGQHPPAELKECKQIAEIYRNAYRKQ